MTPLSDVPVTQADLNTAEDAAIAEAGIMQQIDEHDARFDAREAAQADAEEWARNCAIADDRGEALAARVAELEAERDADQDRSIDEAILEVRAEAAEAEAATLRAENERLREVLE